MSGLRNKTWRGLGATLTGLALGLQLVLSSLGLGMASRAADPADAFAGHALCLAGGVTPPAREAPVPPAHSHFAFCCLWHQLPGVQPVALAAPTPTVFAPVAPINATLATFSPGPQRGPANARAPPILA